MPGLLSTAGGASRERAVGDATPGNGRAHQPRAEALEGNVQSRVGHHGGHHEVALQSPPPLECACHQQQAVTVGHFTLLVD